MERLTVPAERLPDGGTRIQMVDGRAVRERAMELYWRLKKYEDTGLSPDDVTDLMGSHAVAIGELAKVPKWIPVTERLPGPGRILTTDGKKVYLTNGAWMYKTITGDIRIPANYGKGADVTHWMPLPEPPKEEV